MKDDLRYTPIRLFRDISHFPKNWEIACRTSKPRAKSTMSSVQALMVRNNEGTNQDLQPLP